ncbi:DNA/RNA non-specific endonuclease [Acinetobacter baylyi]|uniref:DNA/RNA non-specific endonuclease n=1 Tax=Acinetobacter baylyi TaxID=202950 RepID=UPI0031DDACF8
MGKFILAIVAVGSFAIAFGEGKISQWISPFKENSGCLNQFYREVPPVLVKDSLQSNSYALCFNGFNVMYSGVSKTPLWSAEHLTPQRLSTKIKREDSFHEETRISNASHRALLSDYRGSGYDRGHMSPNGDMSDTKAQQDSFSLANMVPQAPKNNQHIWRELEEATRALVVKQKQDVFVVTGPVFEGKRLKTIGRGVIVPTAVYKAVYLPKTGAIGAYYAPNNNSLEVRVVSVCYLEEKLGINLFPQLTEQQKRNVYRLPLTAGQVKPAQPLSYAHWDGESQCAEDIKPEGIEATQKAFKQQTTESGSSTSSTGIDEETKQALIKQLVEALMHYFLQILR